MTNTGKKTLVIFIFLFIMAIAIFFRFYKLAEIPPGIYPDVAINGNNALTALETHNFQVFYPDNNGREGLFINLIALSFYFFGAGVWAIKIVPAIIGTLTVLGLYLMTLRLFGKKNFLADFIALLSSFFLAVSFWHVNFSRLGFRAIMVPFFLVWGFYFLFRATRLARIKHADDTDKFSKIIHWLLVIGYWSLSGLTFGLGFSTYISYRVAPLIIAVVFIIEARNFCLVPKAERRLKKFILMWFVLAVFVIAAASPMLIYFYNNPQDFMGRTGQVSVFSSATPVKDLAISSIKTLGMFNVWGDCNWRHNFACRPELPLPVGILFLFGFFRCLGEILRTIYKRKRGDISADTGSDNWSFAQISMFLMAWLFAMLLPAVLTNEGLPHALRSIGVIPPIFIFAGIGGWWIYDRIKNYKLRIKKLFVILSITFFMWLIFYSYDLYFVQWGKNSEVKGAFTQQYVDIGNYLNSLPGGIQKYVIVNEGGVPVPYPDGIPMPAQTVIFTQRAADKTKNTFYVKTEELPVLANFLSTAPRPESIVVLMKYDKNILKQLQEKIPQGKIEEIDGIWTLQIKK